jgi:putative transposase
MFENCRTYYNYLLEHRITIWKQSRKSITAYSQMKLNSGLSKELNIHSQVLQQVALQLDAAFKNFYRRTVKHKVGFPRFKGKGKLDSILFPQESKKNWGIKEHHLDISKIGLVRIILHRPLVGKVKQLRIKKWNNQWYACFTVECEPKVYPIVQNKPVGIDVGISKFAVFSDGIEIKNPRFFKRDKKELAKVQRKGNKKAATKIHTRISNRRNDFSHQLSNFVVANYSDIYVEKLHKETMKSFRTMNRELGDVAWSKFRICLLYKAEEAGRTYKELNPHNTTQKCYKCGNIVKKKLKDRWHYCPNCGTSIDRDLNAALNLLALGHQCLGIESLEAQ